MQVPVLSGFELVPIRQRSCHVLRRLAWLHLLQIGGSCPFRDDGNFFGGGAFYELALEKHTLQTHRPGSAMRFDAIALAELALPHL